MEFVILINEGQEAVIGTFTLEQQAKDKYLIPNKWIPDYYLENPGLWAKHEKGKATKVARIKPLVSPG